MKSSNILEKQKKNWNTYILAQYRGEEYFLMHLNGCFANKKLAYTATLGKESYGSVHDTIFKFVLPLKQFVFRDKK